MADVKLVNTPNVPPKWEPFVVVTLSKAEAWLLASILGSSSGAPRALGGLEDGLYSGLCDSVRDMPGLGNIVYSIPDEVLAKYKEMGGA